VTIAPPAPTEAPEDSTKVLFEEARRHGRRRRRIVWIVVLALAIALAVFFGVSGATTIPLPTLSHPFPKGRQLSSTKPVGYYYTEIERQVAVGGGPLVKGGEPVYEYLSGTVQTWVAPNGSGREVTTTDPTTQFLPAKEKAPWLAEDKPLLPPPPGPLQETQEFGRGYAFGVNPTISLFDLSGLPTDRAALTSSIASGDLGVKGVRQTSLRGLSEVSSCLTHVCVVFERAVALLEGPDIGSDPARRAALFEVMANLPGVEHLGVVSDQIGRRGTGLRLVQHGPASTEKYVCEQPNGVVTAKGTVRQAGLSTIEQVVFDQKTATLLSSGTSYSPEVAPVQMPCAGLRETTSIRTPTWTLLIRSGLASSDSVVAGR